MPILGLIHQYEPEFKDGPFLIIRKDGKIDKKELYEWDDRDKEFYGNIIHHIPLSELNGWISIKELEKALQSSDGNGSQG